MENIVGFGLWAATAWSSPVPAEPRRAQHPPMVHLNGARPAALLSECPSPVPGGSAERDTELQELSVSPARMPGEPRGIAAPAALEAPAAPCGSRRCPHVLVSPGRRQRTRDTSTTAGAVPVRCPQLPVPEPLRQERPPCAGNSGEPPALTPA